MAGMAFTNVTVPPTTDAVLQVLQIGRKAGKIQLSFLNQVQRNDVNGTALEGYPLVFTLKESDDRQTWTTIGSTVTVQPGAQNVTNLITNKRYIQILGHGTGGGGYCKIDLFFNGMQYFGQVDIDVVGKSGWGWDGDALDTSVTVGQSSATAGFDKQGEGIYGSTTWPGGGTGIK